MITVSKIILRWEASLSFLTVTYFKENNNVPYPTLRKKAKRFLHVCVAKAVNLTTEVQLSGTNTSILNLDNCYVSLELDEPCQKFRTDPISYSLNQDAAAWNQTFTL